MTDSGRSLRAEPVMNQAQGLGHSVTVSNADWTNYSDQRPKEVGVYEWRMPSKPVAGLMVRFLAHMRTRAAGYSDTISPAFDNWDGYRVHVPKGLQWRAVSNPPEVKLYEQRKGLVLEGVENTACPYCDKVPEWHGCHSSWSGTFVGSSPYEYNKWWLDCCRWARTPHMSDPRTISELRNAALAKGIEARSDKTEGLGPQDDSPVRQDLPKDIQE